MMLLYLFDFYKEKAVFYAVLEMLDFSEGLLSFLPQKY